MRLLICLVVLAIPSFTGSRDISALVEKMMTEADGRAIDTEILKPWMGNHKAGDVMDRIMRSDPKTSFSWSNAVLAKAFIVCGRPEWVVNEPDDLERFLKGDRRYRTKLPIGAEHASAYANAQEQTLGALGVIVKVSGPYSKSGQDSLLILERASHPEYWTARNQSTDRSLKLARLAIQVLGAVCHSEAKRSLNHISNDMAKRGLLEFHQLLKDALACNK